MLEIETLAEVSNSNQIRQNNLFLKNYVTSEWAISHNVSYYQQLFIACYQVSFHANNCCLSNNQ